MDQTLDRACVEVMTACACEGLRRSARAVTSRYQEVLAGSGVRAAQLPILVGAQLMGPLPLTALAETLLIDRTTLTRNLRTLQGDGLVAVEEDEDRRVRLVVLTAAGRAALERAIKSWRQAQESVATSFGPERLRALVAEVAAFTELTRG